MYNSFLNAMVYALLGPYICLDTDKLFVFYLFTETFQI